MPIVDYGDTGFSPLTKVDIDPAIPANAAVAPDLLSTVGAAFRQSNTIISAISDETGGMDSYARDEDQTFNPLNEIKGTKYEARAMDAAGIFNRPYFEAWKRQVDREEQDRATVDAGGFWGTGASAVAALLDLPTFIPGGAAVEGLRGGAAILSGAVRVGAAGGLGAAVSEAGLQATQQTRTAGESAVAIGSGIVFGGLLGAGVGALSSRAEQKAAMGVVDRLRNEQRAGTSVTPVADEIEEAYDRALGQSAGAAAVKRDTLDDLSISGRAATLVGSATARLNPILRSVNSPSAVVRRVMNGIVENSVYLKKNVRGEGDAAVETLIKQWDRGALSIAMEDHVAAWQEARKAGVQMTREDFSRAVGRAARRGDTGENEFVTKAAKSWRERVVEPLKRAGQETGQLPKDLPNSTAESYFHRVYLRDKIRAQEKEFRDALRPWIEQNVRMAIRERLASGEALDDLDFVSDADRAGYVDGILTDVVNKVTGAEQNDIPHGLVSVQQGPLKERTLNVPDSVIEPWLEDDVELVNRRYARKMAADTELARWSKSQGFEGRADLSDVVKAIQDDYEELKKGAKTEKEMVALNKRRDADIRDVKAMRDLLRGNYQPHENSTNFARITRAAQTFNFIRSMGGVLVASLTDAVRPAMIHGLSDYMAEGIAPLIRNQAAFKLSAKEAKQAGAISDRILQSRLATMAELTDPYSSNSPFERFLENAANKFSTLTGMGHWNDFHRTLASVVTQSRVLRNVEGDFGKLKQSERAYMGYLGLNEDVSQRIAAQFAEHGETIDGVRVANTEEWLDDIARRAYFAAINKDVDSTIIVKSVGDVPLFAHSPLGRAAIQFKSFALASNQRVLMRGLQESPGRAMGGVVGMTAVGAFIYWLKQMEAGRPASNNPGTWIAEGLDRSGIFAVGFEINNAIEKAGGPGVYSLLSLAGQAAVPGADARAPASRFATRGVAEGFLGPTFGLANDTISLGAIPLRALQAGVEKATGTGNGKPVDLLTPADISTMRRLAPYASLPYWRWLIDGGFGNPYGIVPAAKEAVQ